MTLRKALNQFDKVYGLDISPKNVELTKKEFIEEGYTNIELHAFDLMKFDAQFESKFDVISFIHGLEHFTSEDYPVILNNIKKYLKPSGVFTGALPFKNAFNYRMCPDCARVFEIDGHVSSHDLNSLRTVFEKNGFKVLHLANFNLKYALKHGRLLKKVYKFIFNYLFKKQSNSQIEYIVTPI